MGDYNFNGMSGYYSFKTSDNYTYSVTIIDATFYNFTTDSMTTKDGEKATAT